MRTLTAILIALLSTLFTTPLPAQQAPSPFGEGWGEVKHEVRAVWLTTIGGLDWPHSYSQTATSARKQQQELISILDRLQHANINTVLLQTRIRATTLFPSDADTGNEPWDGCLSGHPGQSPGYDALAFAIEECHRRGMECHAWVVTIPVGKWNGTGCKHLRNTLPGVCYKIGDEGYMDPSNARTAQYLAHYCASLTRRYDLDGIHLDYIRYPESQKKLPQADEGRRLITRIVRAIHDSVKAVKPWVKMSCSPIGKHDDTHRYWSHGWNARSRVLQDAKAWLREGLMDVEFPMMYFRGNNFYPFAVDWQENIGGRQMVPGLGIYLMSGREKGWPLEDITREMYVLRGLGMGFCMFRTKFLLDDTKGIYRFLCNTFAQYPALQPVMKGYEQDVERPHCLTIVKHDSDVIVSWQAPSATTETGNHDAGGMLYNIYASPSYPVDITDARNIIMLKSRDTSLTLPAKGAEGLYFAVTAIDRYGNESRVLQQSVPLNVGDAKPGWWYVTHPLRLRD